MKSFEITFGVDNLVIPFSYHHQLQSLIYKVLKNGGEETLHNEKKDEKEFKYFIFSLLYGGKVTNDKKLLFEKEFKFQIRFLDDDIALSFFKGLTGEIKFFNQNVRVKSCNALFCQFNKEKYLIRTLSPIELHITRGNEIISISPNDNEFEKMINENFKEKYKRYYGVYPTEDVRLKLMSVPKKYVTLYKKDEHIYITAYRGFFEITAKSEYIEFLYYSGLGSRNSSGFGMFEVA